MTEVGVQIKDNPTTFRCRDTSLIYFDICYRDTPHSDLNDEDSKLRQHKILALENCGFYLRMVFISSTVGCIV